MRRHAESATCRWTPDADDHFRTQCNNAFALLAGTLAENGFVWCPYCRGGSRRDHADFCHHI